MRLILINKQTAINPDTVIQVDLVGKRVFILVMTGRTIESDYDFVSTIKLLENKGE